MRWVMQCHGNALMITSNECPGICDGTISIFRTACYLNSLLSPHHASGRKWMIAINKIKNKRIAPTLFRINWMNYLLLLIQFEEKTNGFHDFFSFEMWCTRKPCPRKHLVKAHEGFFSPVQKLTEIYFTKSVLEFDVKTPNYKMLEIRWNCRWMSIFRYWTHHCVCKCIEAIKKQNQSCLWWPRFRSFYFYQCWRRDGKREREKGKNRDHKNQIEIEMKPKAFK